MTDVEATYEDFIASRRSGRRNAIHEISGTPAAQDSEKLSQSLAQLDIGKSSDEDGTTEKRQECPAKEEASQSESG